MALVGINQPSAQPVPQPGESTFDKVLKGLQVATQLGTLGVNIADSFTKAQQAKTDAKIAQLKEVETNTVIDKSYKPADPSDPNAVSFERNGKLQHYKYVGEPLTASDKMKLVEAGHFDLVDEPRANELIAQGQKLEPFTPGFYLKPNYDKTKLDLQERLANLAKTGAETEKIKAETAGLGKQSEKEASEQVDKLYQQRSSSEVYKNYQKSLTTMRQILDIEKNPSAFSDVALIEFFKKATDPNSIVREGEFNVTASTGGFGDKVQSAYLQYLNGKRLTPDQRADLIRTAKQVLTAHQVTLLKQDAGFVDEAKRRGLDPQRVIRGDYNVNQLPDLLKAAGAAEPGLQILKSFESLKQQTLNKNEKNNKYNVPKEFQP